jgi:hypothetical protein
MMRLTEFIQKTGATQRQVDYWVKQGLPIVLNDAHGCGFPREYDPEAIPAVRVMAQLSDFLLRVVPTVLYNQVLKNYEQRELFIGDDVWLSWRDNGTDEASGAGPPVFG